MKKYIMIIISFLVIILLNCSTSPSQNNKANSNPLPASMKGYELYSWPGEADWQFTLITGTNRNKNFIEIYSDDIEEGESGWIRLRGYDVNSIKRILSRLPVGENVMWNDDRFLSGEQGQNPDISFPEAGIINEIEIYCKELGLKLSGSYN